MKSKSVKTKKEFYIQDWAGNHKFPDKVFNSFDDAWGFLMSKLGTQKVITRVTGKNYYGNTLPGSKYYYGPKEVPAGAVGHIAVEKVPCVRLRTTCKCQFFTVVDFDNGARAAYHKHEFVKVASEVI